MSDSHRQILRSTAITGGASAITLLSGIVKIKVLALLGGPAAVGVMGLLQNFLAVVATVAGCGLASSGVRAIAATSHDAARLASLWKTLLWTNVALGISASILLAFCGKALWTMIAGQAITTEEIGILSLGIIATLFFTTQTALLQGLRRIRDLATVNVAAAIVGAGASLVPIYLQLPHAILWFVVIAPVTSAIFAYIVLRRQRIVPRTATAAAPRLADLGGLLRLGMPIMVASLVTLGTQLAARALITTRLGVVESGLFQAAWAISTTYIGFILGAMAADYYPRLSSIANKPLEAAALVNQQCEMALTMAAPFVLALIAFSPVALVALYSTEFTAAGNILRWQALGDILKILCWPIGYIFLATGRGGLFIAAEAIWSVTYLGLMFLLIERFGLDVAGFGFFCAYVVLAVYLSLFGRLLINYRVSIRNLLLMTTLLVLGSAIIFTASMSHALLLHSTVVVFVGLYSMRRLDQLVNIREMVRGRLFGR